MQINSNLFSINFSDVSEENSEKKNYEFKNKNEEFEEEKNKENLGNDIQISIDNDNSSIRKFNTKKYFISSNGKKKKKKKSR